MARLFRLSCHPFQAGHVFQGLLVHHCCGLSGCSPPLTDLTGHLPQPRGLLHPGFQRVSLLSRCWISLRQSLDLLSVGLSPTGIAASFAAPDPTVQISTQRVPQTRGEVQRPRLASNT